MSKEIKQNNNNKIDTIMKTTKSFKTTLTHSMLSLTNRKNIFASQLPLAIKSFIQNQFQGKSIIFAEKNEESLHYMYEVNLDNGTLLSFNHRGEWTKIINNVESIPASIIPSAIHHFVDCYFPEAMIVMFNKRATGYIIGLSNNVTLKYNNEGQIYGLAS
jgi:hypothetical protein